MLKAVMFVYNSITFFSHIIEPDIDIMNRVKIEKIKSGIQLIAKERHNVDSTFIELDEFLVMFSKIPLPSSLNDFFDIICFMDKNDDRNLIYKYINDFCHGFLQIFSPEDVLAWDGNLIKFLPYKEIFNIILNLPNERFKPQRIFENKPDDITYCNEFLYAEEYATLRAFRKIKNCEQLMYALITGNPVAIVGQSQKMARRILHQCLFFTVHRSMCILEYPKCHIDPNKADIVLITPNDIISYPEFLIVDLEKKSVVGGISNGFCEQFMKKIRNLHDPKMILKLIKQKLTYLLKGCNVCL